MQQRPLQRLRRVASDGSCAADSPDHTYPRSDDDRHQRVRRCAARLDRAADAPLDTLACWLTNRPEFTLSKPAVEPAFALRRHPSRQTGRSRRLLKRRTDPAVSRSPSERCCSPLRRRGPPGGSAPGFGAKKKLSAHPGRRTGVAPRRRLKTAALQVGSEHRLEAWVLPATRAVGAATARRTGSHRCPVPHHLEERRRTRARRRRRVRGAAHQRGRLPQSTGSTRARHPDRPR